MHFISTRYHAVIDYLLGLYVFCIPFMCKFPIVSPQTITLLATSGILIINALFSRHELGCFKVIPNNVHLIIDGCAGVVLAATPWWLSYSNDNYLIHCVIGGIVFLFALCSNKN